ncbi:ankyrin repeat domain-containing protein [Massilia rubra]|nr:ankyrin repeat domain-containing protein [Massilia rubra]
MLVTIAPAQAKAPVRQPASAAIRCTEAPTSGDAFQDTARNFRPGAAPRIFMALGKDRHALLKKLLNAGDDPNICHAGISPLLAAVAGGDALTVTILLDAGARPDSPRDASGGTPLDYALGTPPLEMATLLLDRGADPRVVADGGRTTLHSLALQALPPPQQHAIQMVLAERLVRQGVPLDATYGQGETALHMAASTGNLDLLNLLLAEGANPTLRNKRGEDALACARRRGYAALVERLEQHLAGKTASVPTPAAAARK